MTLDYPRQELRLEHGPLPVANSKDIRVHDAERRSADRSAI
jgi:hypothetical protein